MKNEFVLAFNEVIEEKQLPREVILKALESAMVSAYRRAVNASNAQHVEAKVDPDTGKVVIFAEKEVVTSVQDHRTEVTIEEAKRYNPESEVGMMVVVDSTPDDFGRVAAQTARQVIQQRIRDAERQAQLSYYQNQVGEIISGVVQAVNSQGLTIGLEMRAEGNVSRKDTIPGERFRIHDRVRALIVEVKDNPRGPQIVLSRTHRDFLRRLLENEVPEIYHGVVEIRSIAREPGERAKVAVSATQSGIDPVGACVGIRGVRIQAIVRELHDEKIDVIEWSNDPTIFIAKAISPARVSGVFLNDQAGSGKTATVVVSEDQLSLAIGRDGQNARLAAKLTGWRIDIKSLTEATTDAMAKLQTDPTIPQEIIESETPKIPDIEKILTKKSEGRPLTPEEYDQLKTFVDHIERQLTSHKDSQISSEEEALINTIKNVLPEETLEKNIIDSPLPEHVSYILQEANFVTVGDLIIQMKTQPDVIFKLQGIGPRAMTEINNFMDEINSIIEESTTSSEIETKAEDDSDDITSAIVDIETLAETDIDTIETPEKEETIEAQEEELQVSEMEAQSSDEDEEDKQPSEAVSEEDAEEEDEASFDQLFALSSIEDIDFQEVDEDFDESDDMKSQKQKKKKRRRVEIEYDPDDDVTHYRKKRKRDGNDDNWDWNL